MKNLNKQLNNLALVMSVFVIGVVALMFCYTGYKTVRVAYKTAIDELMEDSETTLESSIKTISTRLELVERITASTANFSDVVTPDDENSGYILLERLTSATPDIMFACLMFKENFYPSKGSQYCPSIVYDSVTNTKKHVDFVEYGFGYLGMDINWLVNEKGKPVWSPPYRIQYKKYDGMFIGYSVPIYDNNNEFMASLCAVVNLGWLREILDDIKPHSESNMFLLDGDGNYIFRSDTTFYSVDNISEKDADTAWLSIYDNMTRGKRGMSQTKQPPLYVFYAPLGSTNWSVALVYPKGIVDEVPNQMVYEMLAVIICTILVLLMVLYFGIFLIIKPFSIKLQAATEKSTSVERDLEIASKLQKGMLPKDFHIEPENNGFKIYGILQPARMVGGDLYDYFVLNGNLFFCIGDVSGKGVSASLFMSMVRTMFRDITQYETSPELVVDRINQGLATGNSHNMFCTMFVAVLDLSTGKMRYCNAGHNAPIIGHRKSDGCFVEYMRTETNVAVGVLEGFEYVKEETTLNDGDFIFLYTDGVTEAENIEKQLFGESRTLKSIERNCNKDAQGVVEALFGEISGYAENAEQSDDITMLFVRYERPKRVLDLTNDVSQTPLLAEWVDGVCKDFGLPESRLFNVQLVLEEVVVNVMKYAYPGQEGKPVTVTASRTDNGIKFVIEDNGIAFNPLEMKEPDIGMAAEERPIGGLGFYIVRQLVDEVAYQRNKGKNILTMTIEFDK